MANLAVADCTNLEVAVLIDTDDFYALPILAAGENRAALLQSFIDSVPFDITIMDRDAMMAAWGEFLTRHIVAENTPPVTPTDSPVGDQSRNGTDAEQQLAEAEAHAAGTVPDTQPADTDQAPAPTVTMTKVRCFNCNGQGTIAFGDDQPAVTCNMCEGKGWVLQEVAA